MDSNGFLFLFILCINYGTNALPRLTLGSDGLIRVQRQAGYVYARPSIPFDVPTRPTVSVSYGAAGGGSSTGYAYNAPTQTSVSTTAMPSTISNQVLISTNAPEYLPPISSTTNLPSSTPSQPPSPSTPAYTPSTGYLPPSPTPPPYSPSPSTTSQPPSPSTPAYTPSTGYLPPSPTPPPYSPSPSSPSQPPSPTTPIYTPSTGYLPPSPSPSPPPPPPSTPAPTRPTQGAISTPAPTYLPPVL